MDNSGSCEWQRPCIVVMTSLRRVGSTADSGELRSVRIKRFSWTHSADRESRLSAEFSAQVVASLEFLIVFVHRTRVSARCWFSPRRVCAVLPDQSSRSLGSANTGAPAPTEHSSLISWIDRLKLRASTELLCIHLVSLSSEDISCCRNMHWTASCVALGSLCVHKFVVYEWVVKVKTVFLSRDSISTQVCPHKTSSRCHRFSAI